MKTAADVLKIAAAEIGTREDPPGSNKIKYWTELGQDKYQGQPWCSPEEWRPVVGWENIYEVSNRGRVRSLDRMVPHYLSGTAKTRGRVLKQIIRDSTARQHPNRKPHPNAEVNLVDASTRKLRRAYKIHRLVAEAFIPNPDALPMINHKDENSLNNAVENLEWCTAKYNTNYGNCPDRLSRALLGCNAIPIVGIKIDSGTKVELPGTIYSDMVGITPQQVLKALKRRQKTAGGYYWYYAERQPDYRNT